MEDTYSFDALLEERCNLALPHRVHQFAGRVMRRDQFHAIDEPVQLLREKHDVATSPDRVLRPVSQSRQRVFVKQVLAHQYDDAEHQAH